MYNYIYPLPYLHCPVRQTEKPVKLIVPLMSLAHPRIALKNHHSFAFSYEIYLETIRELSIDRWRCCVKGFIKGVLF